MPDNWVVCKLCGESFEAITATHLRYAHDTTLDNYVLKFPQADLTSQSLLIRRNNAVRAILESSEYRERKSKIMREVCSKSEWIDANRLAQIRRFENPKEREKLSEAQLRRYQDIEEHRKTSLAVRKALEDPQVRKRNSEIQLLRYQDPEERRKTSEAVLEALSKPEVQKRRREAYQDPLRKRLLSEASNRMWSAPGFWEAHSGENSPFWKGGHGRYGYGWEAIREYILIRDNYICQMCGIKENLQVHHIDHDKENVADSNLITLCGSCNTSELSHPEWKPLLQEKVKRLIDSNGVEEVVSLAN